MNFVDVYLRRLEDHRRSIAEQALAHPQGRDAFEYGRMTGIYSGLTIARDELLGLQDQADEKEM